MLRRILGRPGFSIALVAGVALAALFFLPWLRVVSLGVEVGSATGLELAQGEITTRLATLGGDAVEPRPWFWLGAAIPVPLVAIGAVGSTRPSRRRRAGSALLALSVAGGGVALLALGVTYGRITVVEPEPTNWLWACVGLNGLAALGGLVELAVGLAAGERRSPASRPKRRRTS